jgi:hypothetical protein
MAEFAGYIGSNIPPTDWGKIGREYTDRLIQLNEQRKAEQEKIDDMEAEAYAKVGDIESTSSQPFNSFMVDVVDSNRQALAMKAKLVKQGLLTQKDFKKALLTATTNTNVLNKFAKSYQQNADMLTKAAAEGNLGKYGTRMAERFGTFQNIGNRKGMVDPDTMGLFIADINPETKTVTSKDNISSIITLSNPANSYIPKVDLAKTSKTIKDFLGTKGLIVKNADGSSYVLDSAKNNPEYQTIIDSQTNALTSTPNQITNILADYGGYDVYTTPQEKEMRIAEGADPNKLIFLTQRDNLYVPVLTDEQKNEAKDIIKSNLDASLSERITGRQQAPRPKGDGEGKEKDLNQYQLKAINAFTTASRGWQDVVKNGTKAQSIRQLIDLYPEFDNVKATLGQTKSGDPSLQIKLPLDTKGQKFKTINIKSSADFYKVLSSKWTGQDVLDWDVAKNLATKKMGQFDPNVKIAKINDIRQAAKQKGITVNDFIKQLPSDYIVEY